MAAIRTPPVKKSAMQVATVAKSLEAVLHPGVHGGPRVQRKRLSWTRRTSSTWSSTTSLRSLLLARPRQPGRAPVQRGMGEAGTSLPCFEGRDRG